MIKEISPLNSVLGYDKTGQPVTLSDIQKDPVQGWSKIVKFTSAGTLAYYTARIYNPDIPKSTAPMPIKISNGRQSAQISKPIIFN